MPVRFWFLANLSIVSLCDSGGEKDEALKRREEDGFRN